MFERSTGLDVLLSLKSNLDLNDISTYALFRVAGSSMRVVNLNEVISEVLKDPTESGQDVRLLFKSWIVYHYGSYHREVFQDEVHIKQPSTALWLAYMEGTFMCMTGKYYLSEDESILLGTLKMQVYISSARIDVSTAVTTSMLSYCSRSQETLIPPYKASNI